MVIDSDAHVIEGRELMAEVMGRFPDKVRLSRPGEDGHLFIDGRPYPKSTGPGAGCRADRGLCTDRGADPFTMEVVLRDADREGIDRLVLFPSVTLCLPGFQDLAFSAEFARLYNAWLAGYCDASGGRLHGVAVVPIEDVAASIRLMRAAKDVGLVATMIPAVLGSRNLDHPDLEPFFDAAEALDMPLAVHGAPGIHLPPLGAERFDNYLQVHVVSFPFDMMVATTSLVLGGVFERHPRLRVGLFEAGVGWVPYFVHRLDEHVEKRGELTPQCTRRPREYVERWQLYVSCEADEPAVRFAAEALGPHWILFASDYPHWDGDFPNATRPLHERRDLDADLKARVLGRNARVFFGLPG